MKAFVTCMCPLQDANVSQPEACNFSQSPRGARRAQAHKPEHVRYHLSSSEGGDSLKR